MLSIWTPPPMGLIKLNFDVCALGNPSQLKIEGMMKDHHGPC